MNITIQKSKNNEDTVLINNLFLHSNYNPSKEAERFVENLSFTYSPEIIFFTEPGLSYIIPILRKKFPDVKIGVIRYIKELEIYNKDFDYAINLFSIKSNLEEILLQILGEEKLLTTQFFSFPNSSRLLPDLDISTWKSIKNALEKAKTLLITRQYFEKKWYLNSFNFFSYANQFLQLNQKIIKPVLIISSGPSLKPLLPYLYNFTEKFFIICLSSAISVCIKNKIQPDLCLTTDGGYWAGQHLKKLHKNNIPLACPSEAYVPKSLLKNCSILPLDYYDGLSHQLYVDTNTNALNAKRNGTVSGTALEFALSISDSDIYFAGLDLASQPEFQHCQPNELENNNSLNDNFISSSEKRLYPGHFPLYSLQIYLEWFNSLIIINRKVYRIIDIPQNSIKCIKDVTSEEFMKEIKKLPETKKNNIFSTANTLNNKESLKKYLHNNFDSEDVKKQLYPLDYILLKHENDNSEILKKIEKQHEQLKNKITGIINE